MAHVVPLRMLCWMRTVGSRVGEAHTTGPHPARELKDGHRHAVTAAGLAMPGTWPAPGHATMRAMRVQRFGAHVAAGPRGRAVIAVPFDPDEAWGAKAEHPVAGTINGTRVRGAIAPTGGG